MRTLIRLVLWTWFLAALAVGHFGLLRTLPQSALPGILVGLTFLLLAAAFGIPAVRAWLWTVDLRVLVLLHVSRLIGCSFVILYQQGRMFRALAMPGGWGEIVVAVLALVVVLFPMRASFRRHACIIWNTIGLMNVMLVAATMIRLGSNQPWQIWTFRFLPCSMLPTFLMPLLIATHVIIFGRLRGQPDLPEVPAASQPANEES